MDTEDYVSEELGPPKFPALSRRVGSVQLRRGGGFGRSLGRFGSGEVDTVVAGREPRVGWSLGSLQSELVRVVIGMIHV